MKVALLVRCVIIIFALAIVCGCSKEKNVSVEETKFHGKYRIVSATSDKEIDVNLDGESQTNVLKEIPELEDSFLELIVRDNSSPYVFSQFWQNQYFLGGDSPPEDYNPEIIFGYLNQATVASFVFDSKLKKFELSRSVEDASFPLPMSVDLIEGNLIRVKMSKNLYTRSGWKTVVLEVIYEKLLSSL